MKTGPIFFSLALVMTLAFFLGGNDAHASPLIPQTPDVDVLTPAGTDTDCLRACQEEFKESIETSKSVCQHCGFSVLGLCLSWVTNPNCIESLRKKADRIHDSCADDCKKG